MGLCGRLNALIGATSGRMTDFRSSITWFAKAAASAIFIILAFVCVVFLKDPYGRWGWRSSDRVANLAERTLMVSRALDLSFNAAIVGNSTSIPMQPEVLDRLTGLKFVSLSMSGSQAPAAITTAIFFLHHHPQAKALVVALDDSWCTNGKDVAELRPFPFWLYSDDLSYLFGLFTHASFTMLRESFAHPGLLRLDGYHPYDQIFREHGYTDLALVVARLDKTKRPTAARYPQPYIFEPPNLLKQMIEQTPERVRFIIFWTPRYISIIPETNSPASQQDAACKGQVADVIATHSNATVIDWSEDSPENRDPVNFYETNHYRDSLAVLIERDIASKLVRKTLQTRR